MSFNIPISAATGGIEFGRLTSEDVRKLSVKRIHVTPTLDSMFGPVPGGVHDPALGAINVLDTPCSTCRLNASNCPGHCGHIELPYQCYHPQYMDTTLRLLRSKCVYCHRFRIPYNQTHQVICQLRLLEHGLFKEYQDLTRYKLGSKRKRSKNEDELGAEESEEDIDDLMDRRERFVNKSIKKAKKKSTQLPFHKNPMAIQARKDVITQFLQQVALVKKCSNCKGLSPTYRKDKSTKIFRMPLNMRAREEMRVLDRKAANPLIYLMRERKEKEVPDKPVVNGDADGDIEMIDKTHGAEEEIALNNALETSAEAKTSEIEGTFETQAYMTPVEVHAALTLLFEREQAVVDLLFAPSPGRKEVHVPADIFFMTNVLVIPNKFRPLARQGANQMMEAQMNGPLNRVINAANNVTTMMRNSRKDDTDVRKPTHAQLMQAGIALQEAVNEVIDNPPSASGPQRDQGIKQVLEKKEGLFRMNMMGKRVNFAARSVISPDPNIETNEIGVPLVFARKLTFPEPVREGNLAQMQRLVINGMDKYPGAAAIENENGQVMSLRRKTLEQRQALAKQLSTPGTNAKGDNPKKVYRHLMTGDMVIMNRQPTLHKPSMMCHRARVLKNEKTIRMHYANCNTYNADFDGDEMNMHFPQSELARAEASNIADTDHQYLSATAGKPLRGLIQDHISMGVQFTSRDVFFDREQYQQLLYNCIRPENGHLPSGRDRLITIPPAIIKPKPMWTGKQVITTVLKNIIPSELDGINLTSKSQTSADRWGEKTLSPADSGKWEVTSEIVSHRDTEQVVIFKDGEHLCGILDKAQLGPAVGGLVHSCYELYGHIVAGQLLSVMGRLLTRYLNERAWSCGMDDLYLTPEGDNQRKQRLTVAPRVGHEVSVGYVQLDKEKTKQGSKQLISRLEDVLRNDDQLNTLDQLYNASTKSITDAVSKVLPSGLMKPFPRNQMQAMTTSGAKGSGVNANQISSNLGQQVLEGRRVPIMVSGKTLPLFRAFETDPKAGGYVSGRFLTGIQPYEYYFHAMSGREGLIDTAVKTAKSGYLQRCIIKGLEGLRTEYDNSVRESSNGSIVQFLYGEDGLEVTKQRHLREFSFIIENQVTMMNRMKAKDTIQRLTASNRNVESVQKSIIKSLKKSGPLDPIISEHPPANYLGSTSESFANAVSEYIKKNPDGFIKSKGEESGGTIGKTSFSRLMDLKYMQSVIDAGEAIGVVAAQSVGEPSTQMTLNTFHLAGHSAKNVTLGIPRLREIIMTASPNLMTPTMTIKPIEEIGEAEAKQFAKAISRLPIAHVINTMSVTEASHGEERTYEIKIEFWDPKEYCEEYAIQISDVAAALERSFLPAVNKLIRNEIKKKVKESSLTTTTASHPEIGASVGVVEQERPQGQRTAEREGGEEDIDSDADPDDAKEAAARSRREDDYDEPDEDEEKLQESSDEGEDGENLNDEQKVKRRKKIPQALREQNPDDSASDAESNSEMDTSDYDSEEETSLKVRQNILKEKYSSLKEYKFSQRKGRKARIVLSFSTADPKLLLLPILEKAAHASVVQHIPGINLCACFMEPVIGADGKTVKHETIDPTTGESKSEDLKEPVITTQGVNLLAIRDFQHVINPHTLRTNSVHDMLKHYGVEAARTTIANEISGVFKGHGIAVDLRHITLIADAMTHSGGYKPFSRHGLVKESGSVLNKMSFETVMGFLKDAVLFGEHDDLQGPSARIVAGRRGNMGTGSFDVVLREIN